MEYHFTGTGESPDFTFIADAIVDSVGNRIFYSTIKKTKIKVKSNTAVFLITTVVEGVKSEHSYSVQKSDEEALKAAIADSETHLSASKRSSSSASSTTPSTTAGSSNKDSYGHTKGDAFAIAEKAVKGKLKSPSTAKFCSVTEATIGCSGNTWVVRGWVDAQNSLGATIRTQFAVTFTFASKDMYSLDSCIVT